MSSILDVREIWFTNMCLLGFKASGSEENYNKDMFAHINRKGSEDVLHFLFSKLNPKRASEEFKYCWPYFDKKQEQEFRKACTNWITRIAKEHPQSKLPRMSASLLLSPGGDKFYQLLLRLSTFVLRVKCLEEAKSVSKTVFVSSFMSSGKELSEVQSKQVARHALQGLIVQHNNNVLERAKVTCSLHSEWEKYATQLIWEHRELNKKTRNTTKKLLALEEESKKRKEDGVDRSFLDSTVASKLASTQVAALSSEIQDKRRNARMKKVREMWKSVEKMMAASEVHKEMVESVVEDRVDLYALDTKDFAVQIPDVIIKEYESLSREGRTENTYHAGKVNLICLVQMWKCSLRLLRNQLMKDTGRGSYKEELDFTHHQLQAHRAHLAAARNLRSSLTNLKSSVGQRIDQLESELRSHTPFLSSQQQGHTHGQHMPSQRPLPAGAGNASKSKAILQPPVFMPKLTIPTLELGLIPPTPPPKATRREVPDWSLQDLSRLTFSGATVSTPVAVKDLSHRILQDSRAKNCSSQKDPAPSGVHGVDQHEGQQQQQAEAKLIRSRHIPSSVSRDCLESMMKKEQERMEVEASVAAALTSPRIKGLEKSLSKSKMLSKKNKNPSKVHSEAATSRKKLDMEIPSKPAAPFLRPATAHLVDSGIHQLSADHGVTTIPESVPRHSSFQSGGISNSRPAASSTASHFSSPRNGIVSPRTSRHSSSSSESPIIETDQQTHELSRKPIFSEKKHAPGTSVDERTNYFQVKDLPRAHEILAKEIAAAVAASKSDDSDDEGSSHCSNEVLAMAPQQSYPRIEGISAINTEAFRPRDLIARTPVRSSTPKRGGKDTSMMVAEAADANRGNCGESSMLQESPTPLRRSGRKSSSSPSDVATSGVDRNSNSTGRSGSFNENEDSEVGGKESSHASLEVADNGEDESQPRSLASKNLVSSGHIDIPPAAAQPSMSSLVSCSGVEVSGTGDGGFLSGFSSPSLVSGSESELSQ